GEAEGAARGEGRRGDGQVERRGLAGGESGRQGRGREAQGQALAGDQRDGADREAGERGGARVQELHGKGVGAVLRQRGGEARELVGEADDGEGGAGRVRDHVRVRGVERVDAGLGREREEESVIRAAAVGERIDVAVEAVG